MATKSSILKNKYILTFLKKIASKWGCYFPFIYKKYSFSQCGEDIIIQKIFNEIGIKNPTYLDIGAHHPFHLNNTALLYRNGGKGVNIEPDPNLFSNFLKHRKKDINLNIGIANTEQKSNFYIISNPVLNTFSKEEAEKYKNEGAYSIIDVKSIPCLPVMNVIKKYFNGHSPDFISLDVEGMDEIILKSIDFSIYKPIVICIETISFSHTGNGIKNKELINYLESKGYLLYADTYINSIFVLKSKWIR